jgi:hypothetical protein
MISVPCFPWAGLTHLWHRNHKMAGQWRCSGNQRGRQQLFSALDRLD